MNNIKYAHMFLHQLFCKQADYKISSKIKRANQIQTDINKHKSQNIGTSDCNLFI